MPAGDYLYVPMTPKTIDSAREWRSPLTRLVLGVLGFEALTGLGIYLLPFSRFQQMEVLLHSAAGLLFGIPVVIYLAVHLRRRFSGPFSHFKLLGYVAGGVLAVVMVSGVVLTLQAWFGRRIDVIWDWVHFGFGLGCVVFLAAHVGTLFGRTGQSDEVTRASRRGLGLAGAGVLGMMGLAGLLTWMYPGERMENHFSARYNFSYGVDRPFAPSLSRNDTSEIRREIEAVFLEVLPATRRADFREAFQLDPLRHEGWIGLSRRLVSEWKLTPEATERVEQVLRRGERRFREGMRVDPRQLTGSANCGSAGCHEQIYEEWVPSAHRYAAMDVVFQKVQALMSEERAPEATRYCAGCHDPISLFSGAKNEHQVTLSAEGAEEGISCVVCHSIIQTDIRGNADYTIHVPEPYLYEYRRDGWGKRLGDFLIRAYPRHHVASYSRPLYQTTEFCGACHKQFIDEEVNYFGWVQGQNQYDSWRKSRWHVEGDPAKTLACRECHMPLQASLDPAAGDFSDPVRNPSDGRHRSHRFLGANQFIPLYHQLAGAEEQVEKIVQWLRGEYAVPEIAPKWTEGAVVRLELVTPASARPGEAVKLQTILTNNKAGHHFPTGPLDMIEAWVEIKVTDTAGNVIFRSGSPNARGYLENPQIVFKKELIDRRGEPVDRHNLWDAVGASYTRSLFPGFTDTTQFEFACPGMAEATILDPTAATLGAGEVTAPVPRELEGSELRVEATLWYSKFKARFMDRLFGEAEKMRAPFTAIARKCATIPVQP